MNPPRLIVCIGVSGSGKSTLAAALSAALDVGWIEADDLHSDLNRQHMAAGLPLIDAMRAPWVEAVCAAVNERQEDLVLAFSGLRAAHRQQLREIGRRTRFLLLHASEASIARRLAGRKGHFMPGTLLQSQFSDLQCPEHEPDVQILDARLSRDNLLEQALVRLSQPERHL